MSELLEITVESLMVGASGHKYAGNDNKGKLKKKLIWKKFL